MPSPSPSLHLCKVWHARAHIALASSPRELMMVHEIGTLSRAVSSVAHLAGANCPGRSGTCTCCKSIGCALSVAP